MAIRRHPQLYAKYVWVNLVRFFEGIGYKFDFYASHEVPGAVQPARRRESRSPTPPWNGAEPARAARGRPGSSAS
jgi:hypothetical protein